MPTVLLGNESVLETKKVDDSLSLTADNATQQVRKDLGNQVTTLSIPSTYTVETKYGDQVMWPPDEQISTVRMFVSSHFADKPTWVESDDRALQALVANIYGCREGRPKNWKRG